MIQTTNVSFSVMEYGTSHEKSGDLRPPVGAKGADVEQLPVDERAALGDFRSIS